jgi:hypothetical protein
VVYFGGFFPKLGHFAGFSLRINNIAVRISQAAMGGGHYFFWPRWSCGRLHGAHTVFFRRIFFFILFSSRKSEAAMGRSGRALYFLGCRIANKGAMDGARGGEYYKSKPRWSSEKIYVPGSPSSGLKRSILFLGISRGFLCLFVVRISEAAMGGPRSSCRARRSSFGSEGKHFVYGNS